LFQRSQDHLRVGLAIMAAKQARLSHFLLNTFLVSFLPLRWALQV
jgi:hypothetical protein